MGRRIRTVEYVYLPRKDKAICLRCEKEFKSWDKKKNRICPNCEELAEYWDGFPEHIQTHSAFKPPRS